MAGELLTLGHFLLAVRRSRLRRAVPLAPVPISDVCAAEAGHP